MSLKNQADKKAASLSKTVKASHTISVQLTESAFVILNEAIAKNNHFGSEAQKAQKELNNNLLLTIESAGYNAGDFEGANINPETKELILTKKK